MKYYEMLDIYNFIKNELNPEDTEAYREYVRKMDALFNELSSYFPADKESVYPPISEQDYQRINKVFDEAAQASNNYVESYKNIIPENRNDLPPIQDVAINLNNEFFSKAYVEFKNIKPNPHFSLKDQMEEFRYTNVEIKSNELKKLGAAQSSRIKMTVDINGEEVNGVFTNMSYFSGKKNIEAIFPRMIEKYPKYASFFNSIDVDRFYQKGACSINITSYVGDNGTPFLDPQRTKRMVNDFLVDASMDRKSRAEAKKYEKEVDFYNALLDFTSEVGKAAVSVSLNRDAIGMKEGDRIDARNSAMSSVANLLGCPDLIAKSRPLVIYDEKGKKYQEGTFMEFAKGKDINTIGAVDVMRIMSVQDYGTPEVKRQIANLQVLDYICGNIDRHAGNMLYNIDPKTKKLTGIVGIDNDCAFMKKDMDINMGKVRLPAINTLRVIDADMAETIKKLDEGQLKATLHGYGLDNASVEAAWKRTLQLKQAINNGVDFAKNGNKVSSLLDPLNGSVTIINKNDWDKVTLTDCHQKLGNYFENLNNIPKVYSIETRLDKRTLARQNATIGGLRTAMDKSQTGYLLKKAKDASPWFFASNRYKNIITKVSEYHDTPLVGDNPLDNDNAPKFAKLDEMKQAIDVYKREKISDGYIDENWNLKRNVTGKDLDRILLVKNLDTYAKRIEKEKEIALEAKKTFKEQKKKIEAINEFVKKSDERKEALVNKKLEEEIALQQQEENKKLNDSIHVSDQISNDINLNNNIINNDNNLIKADEVEINNDIQMDKEEVKEKVIPDLDMEKNM